MQFKQILNQMSCQTFVRWTLAVLYESDISPNLNNFCEQYTCMLTTINSQDKNSAKGYVAPMKDHMSMTYNCNSYSK